MEILIIGAVVLVLAWLGLKILRGVFRLMGCALLVAVALAVGAFGWVQWQGFAFMNDASARLHVGMTYEQAQREVKAMQAASYGPVRVTPAKLAGAKDWMLVRPLWLTQARAYVSFKGGRVASVRTQLTAN